jgi:hypothetical protein
MIAALLSCLCVSAQAWLPQDAAGRSATDSPSTAKDGLELTTSIVEQKYCADRGMLLVLRLNYRNIGERNLVLFKYGLAPFEHRISRSVEAATAKDYEQVISPMMGLNTKDIEFGNEPSSSYFVTLKPGESHAPINTINVPIFIRAEGEDNRDSGLDSGRHMLQVKVSTWPFSANSGTELYTRWSRFGDLRTVPLLSMPMEFHVETPRHRSLSDCNNPTR